MVFGFGNGNGVSSGSLAKSIQRYMISPSDISSIVDYPVAGGFNPF